MMEVAKERPSKTKKRMEPPSPYHVPELSTSSTAIDNQRVEHLVKQLENLEVVQDDVFAYNADIQSVHLEKTSNGLEPLATEQNVSVSAEEVDDIYYSLPEARVVKEETHGSKEEGFCDEPEAVGGAVHTLPDVIQTELTIATPKPESSEILAASIPDSADVLRTKESDVADASTERLSTAVSPAEILPETITIPSVQLYPEINRLRLQELIKEDQTIIQAHNQHRIKVQVSAPPVALALEPLTETQLRSFYYNAELERVDDFVDEFLETTIRPNPTDEFFTLVQSYLESCRRVEQLQMDAQDLNQRWDSARRNVWLMENVVLKEQGYCGEGRLAAGAYTIQCAKFQQSCFEELKNLSLKRRNLRVVQLAFAAHQSKTAELQCKHYVSSALQVYRNVTGITALSPGFIRFDEPPLHLTSARNKIRNCITVLFHFLRQPVVETVFNNSCRSWLNDMCGHLLRYSYVDDHLFLLSHVLRCPNGVGVWASGYIQPVCHLNPTADGEHAVDHFLSMLSICLNPIRRREDYLKSFVSPDVVNSWTVVDADGEEERELVAMSEADLLCLLNQFSFDQLFSTWFQHIQDSELTQAKILRLFAFELTILRILFDGIRTYNGLQYKQLCKQLAYVMRQSVQYVAEFWLYFKEHQSDPIVRERLQLEFDRLVLYTTYYGVSSKGLGVWQFLADLPYGDLSTEFQWRIVDLLLSPASSGVSPRDLFEKPILAIQEEMKDSKVLELRMHDLDQMDATYLLTAMSNMACSAQEIMLIQSLTTVLFTACFERPSTREDHHKAGRDLIGAVTERHVWLFSYLLALTESRLDYLGGYALELFDHMPVYMWSVTETDWTILRRWLFQPLASLPNTLSQHILLRCNWGFIDHSRKLFMAAFLHGQVADAVVKAYDELCPVQAGLISGSIKKATKVASSVSGQLSTEQQYMEFCWQLLLRLKLHPFDYGISSDMDICESENYPNADLMERADKGNPFAAFVSFQLFVRSADAMIQSGIGLVERLLSNYFIKPAIVCVVYGLGLLANSEALQNNERWSRSFDALVHIDDTYLQYAKTLVIGNFIGENLTKFGFMLSETILSLATKHQLEASKFINHAIRLCCCSNSRPWNTDRPTLYILNRMIEASFLNDPSFKDVIEILQTAYENILAEHRGTKGGMLSLFRSEKPPTPILAPSHFREFPWLAFCALKAEELIFRLFYRNLVSELMRNPAQTLEHCVKSASTKSNTYFTIDRLVPFMYFDLCCSLDAEHPLLPLVCQGCCLVLFQRVRSMDDQSLPATCMGDRYLRSDMFLSKYNGMKKVLQLAYSDRQVGDSRLELIKAMHSWISDSRLFIPCRSDFPSGLPMSHLLEGILNGNRIPWLDYVDFAYVRSSVEKRAKDWSKIRNGDVSTFGSRQRLPVKPSALHSLFERMKNADRFNLVPPPVIGSIDPVFFIPDVNTLQDGKQILGIIDTVLSNFYASANDFADMQKSVASLDELFFEQLKKLYTDVSVQVTVALKCHRSCASPNNMKVMAKHSRLLENVQNGLDQNRIAWTDTIDNILALVAYNIPNHCVCLYAIIRELTRVYAEERLAEEVRARLRKTGTELFYKFVSVYNDRIAEFPPTKAFFQATIEHLGLAFILRNSGEIEKLFVLIKEKQALFLLLLGFYDTDCSSNEAFLRMYQKLCEWIKSEALPVNSLVEFLKKINVRHALQRFSSSEVSHLNGRSLVACCSSKAENQTPILMVMRGHWVDSFVTGLPSHFRLYLESLLKACEDHASPPALLDDVLAALKSKHADGDSQLVPAVYIEIASFLSNYFQSRKAKCKECAAYGIYHCWDLYASKLWPLLSFCYLRSLLNPEAFASAAEGLRKSFSELTSLFRHWIEPGGSGKEIHSPWSLSVASVADAFVQSYVDCLCYIQRLYSAENELTESVCTPTLEWYVGHVIPQVDKLGSYVIRTYHTHLLRLPWQTFRPTIISMEALRQMVSKDSQNAAFATSIVVRLPWTAFLRSISAMPNTVCAAVSNLLLSIIVRCAGKESNYADCKASFPELLQTLNGFDWTFLEVPAVEEANGYVLQTFDPKCIFRADDARSVEGGFLRLLATSCYFANSPPSTMSVEMRDAIIQKRIRFARLFVSMAVRCSRLPDVSSAELTQFFAGLIGRIDSLLLLKYDVGDQWNAVLCLLSEAVLFLNQANKQLFDESVEAINHWLIEHPDSIVCLALMHAYGRVAATSAAWSIVSEKCISAHFMRYTPTPTWSEVLDQFRFKDSWTAGLKAECQQNACFLSLYAFWTKRLLDRNELSEETLILREVIETVKLISERQCHEAPAALLIGLAVHLLVRQIQFGAAAPSVIALTQDICGALQNAAEGKTGILSSLGLSKRVSYSPRFQLLCLAISNYLAQQIIDDSNLRLKTASVITNSKMQWIKNLRTQKQYGSLTGAVDLTNSFISDSYMHFEHSIQLYAKLAPMVFSEQYVIDQCSSYARL